MEELYPRVVQRECRNPNCPNPDADPRKLLDCSRCKQACYCCKECQVAHWKIHKVECKACVQSGAKLVAKQAQPEPVGRWVMSEELEDRLMDQWEASITPRDMPPGCRSPEDAMEYYNITPDLVTGLPVGAWPEAIARRQALERNVNYKNTPPLQVRDTVEVLAGNHVKWTSVGQRGTLGEYFRPEKKWGLVLEDGQPVMIKAANLKRV